MEALAPSRTQVVECRFTAVIGGKERVEYILRVFRRFESVIGLFFFVVGHVCGVVKGLEDVRSKDNCHVRWEDDPKTTVQD